MRIDFTVQADDWIVAVWWKEIVPRAGANPGWQWFGYIRALGSGAWFWESASRLRGTTTWHTIGAASTDVERAEGALFADCDQVVRGHVVASEGGWHVHGGPTRMRRLAENPFPFLPWPPWLSLRIIERKEGASAR